MGITGLIPFCQAATRAIVIQELRGSRVALDSYWLLHRGSYCCSDKLIKGIKTTQHIDYCLKYLKMLLSMNITPIMVFDGRNLPAKKKTEIKRRIDRDAAKEKAKEYLRNGRIEEARREFAKGVDITHEHALELMKESRKLGVDCITAMYEADSQLAYLNKIGEVQYVISEDSDLILFGCKKIVFKLQLDGTCLLFEAEKLYLSITANEEKFDFEKFRRICILSGCDYLDNLVGIGLQKAKKFMMMTEENDMNKALRKIPSYLNMKKLTITDEYINGFLKAEATFKYMFVYDPLKREMLRLNQLVADSELEHCANAGEMLEPHVAYQLAHGNLNPRTLQRVDNFDPDISVPKKKVGNNLSIWRRNGMQSVQANSFKHQSSISNFFCNAVSKHQQSPLVQNIMEQENNVTTDVEMEDLVSSYYIPEVVTSKRRSSVDEEEDNENNSTASLNPFAKRHQIETKKTTQKISLLESLSKKEVSNIFQRQASNENHKVVSRFFAKKDNPVAIVAADSSEHSFKENLLSLAEEKRRVKYENFYEATRMEREDLFEEKIQPNELAESDEAEFDSENKGLESQEDVECIDLDTFVYKPKEKKQTLINNIKPKLIAKPQKRGPMTKAKSTSSLKFENSSAQSKLSRFGFQKKSTL